MHATKAIPALVISCALWGGCFREAVQRPDDFTIPPKPVTPGSPLEREIVAGYRQYREALASGGTWQPDETYEFKWCPAGVDASTFVPYRSRGRWVAGEDPSATPSWAPSDGAAPVGGDITTHHGWWVLDEPPGAPARWCWVPSVESTPGRVVWREGDGFVGWAPEPPPIDADEDDQDDLAWTFEFAGTLFDDIDPSVLTDSAAESARAATQAPIEGRRAGRTGPSRGTVVAARGALGGFVAAHPSVAPSPSVGGAHRAAAVPLPRAMAIYGEMKREHSSGGGGPSEGLPRIPVVSAHRSESFSGHSSSFTAPQGHAWHEPARVAMQSGGSGHAFSGSAGSGHSASSHSSSSGSGGGGGGCNGQHSGHSGGGRK
jgi:hypothetical protein